jgi:serine/threonine protein kinase
MEYFDAQDLYDHIIKRNVFTERDAACLIRKLISALTKLHFEAGIRKYLGDPYACDRTSLPSRDLIHHKCAFDAVHRDIKPENIMYIDGKDESEEAEIRLVDFGLSHLCPRLPSSSAEVFPSQYIVGTHGFMAPETLASTAGNIVYTPSSDIWAAGCALYCILSGIPPFQSDDPDLRTKVRKRWPKIHFV